MSKAFQNLPNLIQMKTNKEIHKQLLDVWDISELKFQATFMIDKKGNGIFTNLRRLGDLQALVYPDRSRIVIRVSKGDLLENKNYIIKCIVGGNELRQKLNREYVLVLYKDFPPKGLEATPQDFVRNLQEEYKSAKGIVLRGLTGAIKRITYDINKKPETFIFELLQNADDYPNEGKLKVNVRFKIRDNYLVLTHNGLPFTPNNVEAICTIDAGDKKFDFNKTGYKGIGFKSVFKYANYVLIHSGGFCFRFDETYHTSKGHDTFWQLIPIWTSDDQIPAALNTPEFKEPNVSIGIRPKQGTHTLEEIENVFERVFQDDRVLLFLRHVNSLVYTGKNLNFTKTINRKKWLISELDSIEIPEGIRNRLNTAIDQGTDERIPEKYRDIQHSKLVFATEQENDTIKPLNGAQIFSYLPTDLDLGFPFLLNGDFIPDGGRHYLHADLFWNQFLFERAGYMLFKWLNEIYETKQDNNYLILIPDITTLCKNAKSNDEKILLESFKEGMQTGLAEVCFLPTRSGEMKRISEVIIDTVGVLDCFDQNELNQLFPSNANFIHPDIQHLHKLITLIDGGLAQTTYYTQFNYHPFLYQPFFQTWLKNIENHKKFHSIFKDKGLLDSLLTATVFFRKDGCMSKKDELYLSLGDHEERLKWLDIKTIHPELREFYPAIGYTFLKWDHVSFLYDQLSDKFLALNDHLRYSLKNKCFFEFLSFEIDQIPAKYFSIGTISIRNCWMFLVGSKALVNTVDTSKVITIYSDQYKDLFTLEILPSLGFVMLEDFYCSLHPDNTQNQKLFNQLGISSLDNERLSKLITEKLIFHQNAINGKLRNVNILSTKIKVAQALWNLISFHWMHLTREEKEKLKPQIKNFLVLADNGVWMPLGEIYLGGIFTEDNTINILSQQFTELQIRFLSYHLISEQYNAAFWKERFEKLPIKKSIYTLLERDVWPRIKHIQIDRLPAITYQILKYADKLLENGIELSNIPIIDSRNSTDNFLPYIGSEYTGQFFEDKIFSFVPIVYKISTVYLKYGNKNEWLSFWDRIGLERIDSLDKAAKIKINEFNSLPAEQFNLENSKRILIELHTNSKILDAIKDEIINFPVITNNGVKKACDCYFSSMYNPAIDLQSLNPKETLNFLSGDYLANNHLSANEWKKLFLHLGVREKIEIEKLPKISRKKLPESYINAIERTFYQIKNNAAVKKGLGHFCSPYIEAKYLELISNPDVNRSFWNGIIPNQQSLNLLRIEINYHYENSEQSLMNYVQWYLKFFPSVLNDAGQVVIPNQLYRYGLKDPIMDKSHFPEIDLSGIQIGETTLEHFLGFKMEPDFYYVLQQLLGKVNVVRNNELWSVFKSGMDRRNMWNNDEQTAWNSFCQMDTAPSRFGKWVPKSELFFLGTGLKTDIVANHPGVIFSKLIPYAQELGISVLSQNAFSLYLPEPRSDNSFKDVLKARLPHFAFFATGGDENLPQYFEKLEASINEIKCTEVKRIEWVCDLVDPKIAYSEEHYIFHEGVHYHVGRWNSMRASPFQKAMYALFQFEGTPLRFEYYCDFLEWTIDEIIAFLQEAGYTVPKEWIKEKEANKNKEEASKEPDKPTIQSHSQNRSSSANIANGTSAQKPEQKHFGGSAESELTAAEVAEIKALLGQSLSDDDKENAWLIAFFRAIKWYKERGFDTSEPERDYASAKKNKYMVVTAPDEEKSMHRILVRSARNGILRLKYIAWFDLMNSNTELFVLTGNKPGEHKIFKTQKELLQSNKDSIVTKLDAADKYEELLSLLSGGYKEDRKKFSEFSLMFRMEGFTGFKSIFESIYQKEGSNDINEDDLDIG
jgi:hypothetical protein